MAVSNIFIHIVLFSSVFREMIQIDWYFFRWVETLKPPTSLDMLLFSLKNRFFIPAIRRIRSTEPGGGELGIRSVKWCEAWSCSKLEQRILKLLPLHDCHILYHIYIQWSCTHIYICIYNDIHMFTYTIYVLCHWIAIPSLSYSLGPDPSHYLSSDKGIFHFVS